MNWVERKREGGKDCVEEGGIEAQVYIYKERGREGQGRYVGKMAEGREVRREDQRKLS